MGRGSPLPLELEEQAGSSSLWAHPPARLPPPCSKNARGEEKDNLTAQALNMSLKYHFVTPLTSMVVTKPEDNEEQTAIADKPGEGGPEGDSTHRGLPDWGAPGLLKRGRAQEEAWSGAGQAMCQETDRCAAWGGEGVHRHL